MQDQPIAQSGIEEKKPKRHSTPAEAAAGAENLRKFLATVENPPALRSGVFSATVKAGRLPAGHAKLQRLIDEFYSGWVEDLGGEENLTSSKRALLWVARGNLAVFALGLEYIRANGLTDGAGDVRSVAKVLATYGNSLRLNLIAVGLERVPRNVTKTLDARLTEIAEREAREEDANETQEKD